MFIINKYREDMPFPKKLLEDIIFRFRYLRLFFKNNRKIRTFLFYPHYPSKRSVLYKILGLMDYNRTNNPELKYDYAINWQHETFREEIPLLEKLNKKQHVINLKCNDISKKYVDRIFKSVFGYCTEIDPVTYKGICVKKNNINAMHDGKIIECPVNNPDKNYIYQKLINNTYGDTLVQDIRTPVIKGNIPVVYLKRRPVEGRFAREKTTSRIGNPDEIYSDEERNNIKNFCEKMNLEYGDIDILRDNDDGKIYIVDVNNTPHGPEQLSRKEKKFALEVLAREFRKAFMQ
ncbi:MAG: hypothetical protein JSV22_08970 [Bacteroidales bacterium]|nr:MAG: hypothetical protein JSV22_08970 [Bacteroidales bacterium]